MNNRTTYWPDGVTLAQAILDNGDDTAECTDYNEDGTPIKTHTIEWDSNQVVLEPELKQIPQSAIDKLATDLSSTSVNTLTKLKQSLNEFLDNIQV